MEPITYSLTKPTGSAGDYYRGVACFADEVIERAARELDDSITEFARHAASIEGSRSREEYLFDLLALGVAWRTYMRRALQLPRAGAWVLEKLYAMRSRRHLKSTADRIRGIAATLLLDHSASKGNHFAIVPSFHHLPLLLRWLRASGEFREEVKRFEIVASWLGTLPLDLRRRRLTSIIAFARWFEVRSRVALGAYTENVDAYISSESREHRWREDVIFCARRRVEYHLSMVGAELMNRAFRTDFLEARSKAVLVPACMSAKPEGGCQAERVGLDARCTHCTPGCRIHQITILGAHQGFNVRIIPHSSQFSKWLGEFAVGRDIGVVGVACPLNLITGGLELKALDVPAQCVLLNECGCRNHWHETGIPTSLDLIELKRLLSERAEARRAA